MILLSYDRYCAEIVAQTNLLRFGIEGTDFTAPVPFCPDWNLGQLLRHLGGGHCWVETIVRTRATQPLPDEQVRHVSGYGDEDSTVLDTWLAEGAAQLADTLRAAGPMPRYGPRSRGSSRCSGPAASRTRPSSTGPTRPWP